MWRCTSDLSVCRYVRMLQLPERAPPQLLVVAPSPGILLAHDWKNLAIHAYTINGRHLATAECKERLSAFAVSADGRFLLTGGVKGVITLRWLHSLQVGVPCVTFRCIVVDIARRLPFLLLLTCIQAAAM